MQENIKNYRGNKKQDNEKKLNIQKMEKAKISTGL